MTDTPGWEQHAPRPEPLRPHRYPLPIVLVSVVTVLAAGYAAGGIPTLLDAGSNLHRGEQAISDQRYDTAISALEEARREAPGSRSIVLHLAYAQIAEGDFDAAFDTLRGLGRVSRSELRWLDSASPIPILNIFEEEKP